MPTTHPTPPRHWLRQLAAPLMLCAMLAPADSGAVGLAVQPPASAVLLGEVADVAIAIEGLVGAAAPSLGSYELTLSFDPAVVEFVEVLFGDPLLGNQLNTGGFGTLNGAAAGALGVNMFEVSLDAPDHLNLLQAGSFVLATVRFRAIGVGTTGLAIDAATLLLGDAYAMPLAAALSPGALTVALVPEPSAAWLFAFGGAVVGGCLARRRAGSVAR